MKYTSYQRLYEAEGIVFGINITNIDAKDRILQTTDAFLMDSFTVRYDVIMPEYEICVEQTAKEIRTLQQCEEVQYIGFKALRELNEENFQCIVYFPDLGLQVNYQYKLKKMTISYNENNSWYHFYVGWMIRELLRASLISRGKLLIHCSAVDLHGKAVLLCGTKGSGKTSLLLEMMDKGSGIIGNDKVSLDTYTKPIKVSSFPVFVSIGLGTLNRFSVLKDFMEDFTKLSIPQYKLTRQKDDIFNSFSNEKKLILLTKELLDKFPQSKLTRRSDLSAIVSIQFDDDIEYASLTEVTDERCKLAILDENICLGDDEVFSDIFSLAKCSRQVVEENKKALINNVKFYSLKQNLECIGSYDIIAQAIAKKG